MAMDDRLVRLRGELDALDENLLTVVRRRNELAREIAKVKAEAGGSPLFERKRERAVYARAERIAREIGLAPDVARQLIEVVVEASHRSQEWISWEMTRNGVSGEPRRFLFVGGAGRMARRLSVDIASRGHKVDVLEPGDPRDPGSVVAAADVVVIAVPMENATAVARQYAPFVRSDALMCDINSLKEEICAVMEEYCRGEVLGLHPMFGPTVHSLRRQKIVVCPVREGPVGGWLRRELGRVGLEIMESDPDTHDRMMAVVQVLVHFATMALGEALRTSGVTVEESLRFTSPIYRLELAFVGRLFAQSPELYAEIEMTNPYGARVREHFVQAVSDVHRVSGSGDRRRFREMFEETARWFHGFQDEAMLLSDRIIDSMVRNP